ncbi:MAG: hypothetical protein WDZ94_03730 [Patescibacteria group bacterium]
MSHSQTLNKLLDAGINIKDFQISAKDLDQQFRQVGNILLNLGWFTQDYATGYQCSQCGAVHEVVAFNGKYFIGCDVDGDSGLETLSKDDLLIYRFSATKFFEWLQQSFSLQGNVESTDDRVLLGQGTVNGKQRLFIFSHENSPEARKVLCQKYLISQPLILYLSTIHDNHNQGYDINLAHYLVVQEMGLSIDTNSALSAIADSIPPFAGEAQTNSSIYAIELKLVGDKIVLVGTALGGSYPAFKAKKKRSTAMSRLLRTLLNLHENDKETTSVIYKQSVLEANYIDPRKNKLNDLAEIDLSQDKRPLSELCSLLLPYLLAHRHHKDDGLVVEFKPALSQESWNRLPDSEKQKILASKAN